MARPRKLPTCVVRLPTDVKRRVKRNAKRKGMSLPDYLAWRLSK